MIEGFDERVVTLHDSQAMIQIINANTTYCTWPRAGGKTSGGIGPRFLHLSQVMPRSQILLFSDTYDRLTDRIVPNIIDFLENKLGLIEGLDFIKYKKPPDNWEKPIIKLDKFERVISFSSGTAICLVSLRVVGSANAYNAQAAIGDEVKFCDESKLNTEVLPALRGSADLFGHLPEYLSVWMFTDKFGSRVKWILAKRKLVNQKAIDIVYTLQMEIFRLEANIATAHADGKLNAYYRDKKRCDQLREKANAIRKKIVFFSDMKPYENRKTLGEFYFQMQKRVCGSQFEYDVAILNHDPDKVENCFYPTFTDKNKYSLPELADYDPTAPLVFALDYNYRIAPMPVAQPSILPGNTYQTLNFIDALYSLYPEGLEDVIKKFCERYANHDSKEVHFIYDHTAIGRNALKTTYKSEVIRNFKLYDWDVIEHFIGDAPDHDVKYQQLKQVLSNTGTNAVKINQVSCYQLIVSIENSPAILSGNKTKKDKTTEGKKDWPAEDSTHFSDAFDMLIWGMYERNIINIEETTVIPISFL